MKKILCLSIIFILLFSSISLASETIPVWSPTENNLSNTNSSASSNNVTSNNVASSSASIAENSNSNNNSNNNNTINNINNNISNNNSNSSTINNNYSNNTNAYNSSDNINTNSAKSNLTNLSSQLLESSLTIKDNPLKLTCGSAILIEQNSGQILYEYNSHEKLHPASVTKVMTLLLIMEALDEGRISLTDKVPCTEDAAKMGGSQIWLDTREELTVDEMLKAICVVSANDCTVAMAEYLEQSQEAFVDKMNQKAKELGMNDTHFVNCHGIDDPNHLTSAHDIAIMSRELLTKHPVIKNYTTIYMDTLRDGKSQLVNTNKLIRNYSGATGLKTGSTSQALFNLSASATRDNVSLIAVIMKGETSKIRFSEATKLLNYGFGNYGYKNLANANDEKSDFAISNGLKYSSKAVIEKDYGIILPKSNKSEIQEEVKLNENITAPIKKGDKVGELDFMINGEKVGSVNLVSSEDIDKNNYIKSLKNVLLNWFSLGRV